MIRFYIFVVFIILTLSSSILSNMQLRGMETRINQMKQEVSEMVVDTEGLSVIMEDIKLVQGQIVWNQIQIDNGRY